MTLTDQDIAAFKQSGQFDESWYLAEYPDVALTGLDPAHHYLWIGSRIGRKPSPAGAASAQTVHPGQTPVNRQPDQSGIEPGLPPAPAAAPAYEVPKSIRGIDGHIVEVTAKAFDGDYYLALYPDVGQAGVNPLEHYLTAGWREGRDPCLEFSTRYYLETNPDVASAGVNPFFHYLVAGKAEGREGRHQLGFRYDILAQLQPVAEQIAQMKAHRRSVPVGSAEQLKEALGSHLSRFKGLLLSFSHDDFARNVGGIQLLLRRELTLIRSKGWLQVHLYPAHPLSFLESNPADVVLGVKIDGQDLGFFLPDDLAAALANCTGNSTMPRKFVIHSLLGHNMGQTLDLLAAANVASGFFWIHDYAAIYNNYKLMRNDVEYRGVPKPGTNSHMLCEYARADFSHADQFKALFDGYPIDVISPSQAAMDIWQEAGLFKQKSIRVIEHCSISETAVTPVGAASGARPMRVGFLGYPTDHKGWPVFQELVLHLKGDSRYEFHHLGKGRSGGLPVTYQEVSASSEFPDLMRQAVAAAQLDAVVIWALWPETFCLTAYEAMAGGAAIIASSVSGNVAAVVKSGKRGVVLEEEAEIFDYFLSGKALELSRAHGKSQTGQLVYSELTAQCLESLA